MSRKVAQVICIIAMLCMMAGCGGKQDKTEKLRDLKFEVMSSEQIPEELKKILEEEKSLIEKFGDEYRKYKSETKRYFLFF